MKTCPPCHGECNQGRSCPAEFHPAYESWANWVFAMQSGIEATKLVFAKSVSGKTFRAGWDAARRPPPDEWKKQNNDQA